MKFNINPQKLELGSTCGKTKVGLQHVQQTVAAKKWNLLGEERHAKQQGLSTNDARKICLLGSNRWGSLSKLVGLVALRDLGDHAIAFEVLHMVVKPFLAAAISLTSGIDDHHALKNLGGAANLMD